MDWQPEGFVPDPERIDPALVPKRQLRDGAEIPAIGLGTFASDNYPPERIGQAVLGAAQLGYRHFDCARVYGNEHMVGRALGAILASGIAREELWITSKLWNDKHGEADVIPSCRESLEELGLDYLDCYMIHWPFPNHHPPGCDVDARSADARPYIHADYLRTWRQLERLVEMGLVRHLGVSNMTVPKLELLLRDAEIPPALSQMELHPHFQQPELFRATLEAGIVPVGYSPLGSPSRPERDRTPDDTFDMGDPVVVAIAERMGISASDVCLKWAVGRGQVTIPFSVKREQYLANLRAVAGEPLTSADMAALAGIDRGCRLVKGHVFLWPAARDWEDLWDPNGEIVAG